MNKTVFITGTSTGFGKLTAITLANAGLTVIAGMRNTGDKNRTVAEELGAIAQGTDVEFINARADIKAKWVAAYMG